MSSIYRSVCNINITGMFSDMLLTNIHLTYHFSCRVTGLAVRYHVGNGKNGNVICHIIDDETDNVTGIFTENIFNVTSMSFVMSLLMSVTLPFKKALAMSQVFSLKMSSAYH